MFAFRKTNNTAVAVPGTILMPATNAESYVIGEALKLSSGAVTKASGTNVPEYICVEKKTAVTGDKVACVLIERNQEYETVTSADGALTVGVKYTIDSDGLKVTATSTSGVAEVVRADGTTSGSKVVVRF